MICVYCGKIINKYTLTSLFLEEDVLCCNCRSLLKINKRQINIDSLKVETFYDYDGLFKNILIQYKECFDEALADVFLYTLKDYIKFKYHGYQMMLIPSSKEKLQLRGFNHLELIFKSVGLKMIDGLKMKEELTQEGKNLRERELMKNNYYYQGPSLDKVLLVDDVVTSGSSLLGAYKAISTKSNRIRAISLSYKKKTLSF